MHLCNLYHSFLVKVYKCGTRVPSRATAQHRNHRGGWSVPYVSYVLDEKGLLLCTDWNSSVWDHKKYSNNILQESGMVSTRLLGI